MQNVVPVGMFDALVLHIRLHMHKTPKKGNSSVFKSKAPYPTLKTQLIVDFSIFLKDPERRNPHTCTHQSF